MRAPCARKAPRFQPSPGNFMLSFFRRIINSRAGVVVTMVTLGVIALAFAAGDVSGLRTQGMSALTGSGVAKVGGTSITAEELRTRAQAEFDAARQQQPTLTMAQFIAAGGVDGTLQRLMTGIAFARFGEQQGMVVSKRAIDGALASIPGLQGINGQFDEATYRRLLASRKLTDAGVRTDLAQQTIAEQLTLPTIGATQVPDQVALPYASLLLEKRHGQVGFVPTKPLVGGAAPSDAELAAYYKRNTARYTLPERRVVRYALVTPDTVKAKAIPTEAEIAAAYNANRATYAAAEKRTVESVVAADQATAAAIAAKVKSGASLADAAKGAGLEAASLPAQDKTALAAATSPAIADALFAAGKGALVGPLKAPLGFVVARVKAVEQVAARSLDQARAGIVADLTRTKSLRAMGTVHDALDDSIAHNATFDELAADQKLAAQTSPALLRNGVDPEQPTAKPDPALVPLLAAAFQADDNDPPQLVQTGKDGSFALVALGRIVHAAPKPLAEIKAAVTRDMAIDRALAAARKIAAGIVAKANAGTPFAQAVAGAGASLPPIKPVDTSRAQLAAAQGQPPAPLVLLFNMAPGTTKLLEAPGNGGYYLIRLDRIEPGNAAGNAGLVAATRTDLGKVTGREYAEQFAKAVRAGMGVSIDQAALAKVKADLAGAGGSASDSN
jgi:peptidyl-prolyl cis-trans isomerase D